MATKENKRRCDILVTYCWNRVGYNIVKSLSNQGLSVWVADTSKYNICSLSKYSSGSFTYPNPFKHEDEFIKFLVLKVKELKPICLLPTHDESIIIAKHRELFPKDLIIPIDNYQKLITLSDKKDATELAQSLGVPVPRIFDNIDTIEKYPIVCKTRIGNSAKGVFFPNDKHELEEYVEKFGKGNMLLEEKIGGTDHSVDCFRWGNTFYASVYKALVTKTEGGGTTTQRVIVNVPMLVDYAKKILDSVDFYGVCGMDFRYDTKTNEVGFIEVNARYTGGLATPIAAGFNIPWIHYCAAIGKDIPANINIKEGTKTKWILGDIITLVGRCLSFSFNKSEMKTLFNFDFDYFDDYDKHDKKAFLGELLYYLCKLIKNRKLNP